MCRAGACGSQKRKLDSLTVKSQVVVNDHVGAGNGARSSVGAAGAFNG